MKKLISLLVFVLFAVTVIAQDSETAVDMILKAENYKANYGLSSQVISTTTDSVFTYTYDISKVGPVSWSIQQKLDSISGTPCYKLYVNGKKHWDESWSVLSDVVTWKGTSTDTTIFLSKKASTITWTSTGNLDTLINTQSVVLPDRIRFLQLVIEGQAETGNAQARKHELVLFKEDD